MQVPPIGISRLKKKSSILFSLTHGAMNKFPATLLVRKTFQTHTHTHTHHMHTHMPYTHAHTHTRTHMPHTHAHTHTHTHAHTHPHTHHTHTSTHTHHPHTQNGQDDESDRKSDIFSKRLETLSLLSFEVGGETFSSQQQTFFAPDNSQQASHQQHRSGAGVNTTDVRRHLYDKQDSPLGVKGASSRKTDLESYNHTPHQTSPSPTDQDESVFDSQQDQLREEEGSRHSLSPSHGSTMDHLDTQNLSYNKKSRTLEMPAKPNRKSRTRLGSNPNPIRPAHPAS